MRALKSNKNKKMSSLPRELCELITIDNMRIVRIGRGLEKECHRGDDSNKK